MASKLSVWGSQRVAKPSARAFSAVATTSAVVRWPAPAQREITTVTAVPLSSSARRRYRRTAACRIGAGRVRGWRRARRHPPPPVRPGRPGPDAIRRAARHAEELGFADVWVSDHVVQPAAQGYPSPYLYDPFLTLAWAAAATERIGLGTSVLGRRPVPPALAGQRHGVSSTR